MGDRPTMQDVLQRFYPGYLDSYVPNTQQEKVVRHIARPCRTNSGSTPRMSMYWILITIISFLHALPN